MLWFDGHLDLAMLAVNKRDMLAPLDPGAGPWPPAACTLPSLDSGNIRLALATIFTEPGGDGPEGYAPGDRARARQLGRAQLEVYRTWQDQGVCRLDLRHALANLASLSQTRGGMGVAHAPPLDAADLLAAMRHADRAAGVDTPLRLGLLMENADPIDGPDDVAFWVDHGLVAVGLAWACSSRYAGGNTTSLGLSDEGRELVNALDHAGVRHDVSHLSDRAFDELASASAATLIASHSNCRALTDPSGNNQRHLTDPQITEIARRGGVVGLNLYSKFLHPDFAQAGRVSVAQFVDHAEHVASLAGPVSPLGDGRLHVALGTDLDGGFPASRLPLGINEPSDFGLILEELLRQGWTDRQCAGFAHGNWLRVLLPR
jgi:membrane dipeptidase